MPVTNAKHHVFTLYDMNVEANECWHWHGAWGGRDRTKRPYFQHGKVRQIAYRIVYELVHGVKLTTDQLIRHTCDNGDAPVGCGNPAHLLLGNNVENMQDMKDRGRHGLPRNTVKAIRRLLDLGRSASDVAELYGLSVTSINSIKHRRTYADVSEEDE